MIKSNKDRLVQLSVQGKIHHPIGGYYRIDREGSPIMVPAIGGIVYNVKVGDPVFGIVGDHIEPGVSIRNQDKMESEALNAFSCIGNQARVVSGDAKGARGYVTGIHGGIDNVIISFESEDLEKMAVYDSVVIKAYGQGLTLDDYPDIKVMNIDPDLFMQFDFREEDGTLSVPVAARIPARLMGSGQGTYAYAGDYDIMTADLEAVKEHGIDKLRFGDLVLLEDCDNSFGRGYLKGAMSVGVVIHGDGVITGHGPGVTTILSSKSPILRGHLSTEANISNHLYKK